MPGRHRQHIPTLHTRPSSLPTWFFALISVLFSVQTAVADDYEEEYAEREVIVQLLPGSDIEAFNARWNTVSLDAYPAGDLYLVETLDPAGIPELADQMEDDPDVLSAEPNFIEDTPEGIRQLVIVAVGGDLVDFEDQEIGSRIGLDAAHAMSRGAGVRIAVLDTGVDPNHEALIGHLSPLGYDFVDDDEYPWEEANGIDDDLDGNVDEGFGHGTMVAGILALVAPEAEILPIRVLGDDARTDAFTVCKALRYAEAQGATIVNMSFGVPTEIDAVKEQAEFLEESGVLMVSGAGNQSSGQFPFYPAAHDKVIMVSAVDSLDHKADFADWGDEVEICAPGTGVRSAYPGGWAMGSGCSFATPFVTGLAALATSIQPTLEREELHDLVIAATEPIDHLVGNSPFAGLLGSGRIYLPLGLLAPASAGTPATADRLRIFPNPTSDWVTLELPDRPAAGSVRIFDAQGREIVRLRDSGSWRWDTRNAGGDRVPSGIYYVRFDGDSESTRSIQVVR